MSYVRSTARNTGGAVEEVASNATGATVDADGAFFVFVFVLLHPPPPFFFSTQSSSSYHYPKEKFVEALEVNVQESGKLQKKKEKKESAMKTLN